MVALFGLDMPFTRAAFSSATPELLSRGARFKPAVWRWGGEVTVVVKDVRDLPFWSRPLARWLLDRERRIMLRLSGLEAFPQVLAELDRDAFVIDLLPGQPLTQEAFLCAPREITTRFQTQIQQMHARGVFHLDLRQRQNILLDGEQPYLIDFGAAFSPNWLGRKIWGPLMRWVDRMAPLKYLARWAPQELSADEIRLVRRTQRLRKFWLLSPNNPDGEDVVGR
ncbi:MAG: hypothetical protein HN844_05640 [Planctomycetes bacterium]|nr:hypothetical protein [Planctomycetota bacterium]MBT5101850.1 hypothetical protein [Planctomycetota bacterium]MBT7318686.1 hypothetical protein [Planctomycetota bacterium]